MVLHGSLFTLVLSDILSNSYACGKKQIFAKEWVGYAISLASIAIAKESLFGIAIAKLSVNGPLLLEQEETVNDVLSPNQPFLVLTLFSCAESLLFVFFFSQKLLKILEGNKIFCTEILLRNVFSDVLLCREVG